MPVDRVSLVKALKELAPPDFNTLVAAIPDAATHVTKNAPVPEQVAELLRWAESTTGPKLEEVYRTAQRVLTHFR